MCKCKFPEDEQQVNALLRNSLQMHVGINLTRLGSMTNRTYRVDLSDGRSVIVRLPGEGTQEMIDRADEKTSTLLANRLGLDAPLLYFGANGEKVTVCIPDAVTMTPEMMRSQTCIRQTADILRKLHTCGETVGFDFDVFSLAELYEEIAVRHNVSLFPDFSAAKNAVLSIREDQNAEEMRVFCHNDPIYANWLLDRNDRLYLIDWEYAGMNDPMWDLADLSIESDFTPSHDALLLESYLQHEPDKQTVRRFLANKVYVDYVWSLWAKAREPFEAEWVREYGMTRYSRMQQMIVKYQDFK